MTYTMRALLVWGTVLLLAASLSSRAEGFAFEVASPKFKVTSTRTAQPARVG